MSKAKQNNSLTKIEEIEFYYLNVISKYISADIYGLKEMLEGHNKTWQYWQPNMTAKGSYFDTGSERVLYMLLNRGDVLGLPNANPVGSDNSFLKFDSHFKEYIAINLDVKSIKANTNLNDVISNIPIGINQNSYDCSIEYKYPDGSIKEKKHYAPGLRKSYIIKDQHNVDREYLALSYEIVILYEQLPIGPVPKREEVIGIFVACIPNGKLYPVYGNTVFNPGKTSDLKLDNDQEIYLPNNRIVLSNNDNIESIVEKYNITTAEYYNLNGLRDLKWNVDGRFDYINNQTFKLLNSVEKKRIVKLFLDEERLDYQFYFVDKNKIVNRIKRQVLGVSAVDFLKNLKTI
jgi:hypothetical protein